MPQRRLINDVFLRLAIDAGADSGILDPVTSHIDSVMGLDRGSRRYRMAEDLLLGRDQYCASFIRAHRKESWLPMAEYRILRWQEIPAQVRASGGGKRISGQLPPRYQEEIDRVAMEEGLYGSDEYLEQWKWGPREQRDGDPREVLDAVIAELVAEWDRKLFGEPAAPS